MGGYLCLSLFCDDETGDCCSHVVTPTPKVAFPVKLVKCDWLDEGRKDKQCGRAGSV